MRGVPFDRSDCIWICKCNNFASRHENVLSTKDHVDADLNVRTTRKLPRNPNPEEDVNINKCEE